MFTPLGSFLSYTSFVPLNDQYIASSSQDCYIAKIRESEQYCNQYTRWKK